MRIVLVAICLITALVARSDDAAEKSDPAPSKTAKERLAPINRFVGEWKGAGQVQRGSTKGAWSEDSNWRWEFDGDSASIAFDAPEGKHFIKGVITPHEKEEDAFALEATPPGSDMGVRFIGKRGEDGDVVFTIEATEDSSQPDASSATADGDAGPARISLKLVADGDRLVMLLEKRIRASGRFVRIAEIGYTRQGGDFAKNARGPECVVTGGLGVIEVSYLGQTYFVCCAGCREAFNEDPQKILAEYEARRKSESQSADD